MAYIYEYIRTQGFEPMHFEEHYARLETLACDIFHHPIFLSRQELKQAIVKALQGNGASQHTVNAVCIRLYDNEKIDIEVVEMLYNNFSLRALRPEGYITPLFGELLLKNTSAKESMLSLNHAMSQQGSSRVPIWIDQTNCLVAIDGAPVVAIFEDEVRFSECGSGVEFDLAYTEANRLHRQVGKGYITISDLKLAKELLAIDYRGITAISGWEDHHYMDIVAEKLARVVSEVETR